MIPAVIRCAGCGVLLEATGLVVFCLTCEETVQAGAATAGPLIPTRLAPLVTTRAWRTT